MANIGYATLQVIPSLRGVDSAIKGQLAPAAAAEGTAAGAQAGKGFGGGLGTALKAVGGFVLVQQATQFFKGAFSEAQESNKVAAQTEAVLKSTGRAAGLTAGQIGDLADSQSRKAGIDDEIIQKGENMLLTFRNVRNEQGKGNDIFTRASKVTLDLAVAFSKANGGEVDLQRNSILVGKALNDPVRGMSSLTRVGVTFTNQQREQVAALVASGDKLGAQKIILRELNKEFGGSAAAQATAADKAGVAWKNLQEAIGKALIPVVAKLGEILTPVLEFLANNQPVLIALAAIIGGALVAAFTAWAISAGTAAVATLAAAAPVLAIIAAIGLVVAAAYFLWNNWDQVWTWIKDHPAIAIVIAILAAPVAAFVLIIGGLKTLYENWDSIWGAIRGVAETVWNDGISPVFEGIKTGLGLVGTAVEALRDVWGGAWGAMKTIVDFFGGFISKVGEGILTPVKAVWNTIADAINGIDLDIDGISFLGAEIIPDIHFHPHLTRLAKGGFVPGAGNRDSVPALLTPGEYVMSKDEVAAWRNRGLSDRGGFSVGKLEQNFYGELPSPAKQAAETARMLRNAAHLVA